jgi:AAHS family cis,cis-muconate transporter-like MFS transporter
MAESFATRVRGTAMGAAWNFGRIGGAAAPLAIGFTATYHSIGLGFVIMGGAYFIAGIIPSLFIKEKIYDTNSLLSG